MVFDQGSCVHDGTWNSAVYGLAEQDNLRKLRKEIGYSPVPVVGAKLKRRYKKRKMKCTVLSQFQYLLCRVVMCYQILKRCI